MKGDSGIGFERLSEFGGPGMHEDMRARVVRMVEATHALIKSKLATAKFHREVRRSVARWKGAKSDLDQCRLLIRYELRMLETRFSIPGDNDEDDLCIFYAGVTLCELKMGEDLRPEYDKYEPTFRPLLERARIAPEIKEALTWHFLFMHDLFAQTTSSPEDAARFLDRARNTTPGVLPLDAKKLKRTRREIRNRLRRLHSTLSDRYGFKLDISLSDIAGLAAVWSVLFLISGYLYTSTLLNALGVRASIFLGISDYVASSVDQIRYAGFATAWGAFTYLLGAFSGTRKSVAQTRAERPLKERNRKAILALILTSAAASLWMYFFDKDNYFEYAKNTGALASMFVADMIATRAFKQPLQAAALLTAVFSFAIYMFAAVGETIYKFDSGKWKPLMNARVILRSPTDTSLSDTRVFGAAGNYLILVHMPSKKVVLVPRDRIEQVDIEPNE